MQMLNDYMILYVCNIKMIHLTNIVSNTYDNETLSINDIMSFINCLCGSVAKASDTQAVGDGFEPRPDH